MPAKPITEEKLLEYVDLVKKHGSVTAAAKAAGMNRSTFSSHYQQAKRLSSEKFEIKEKDDIQSIWSIGTSVRTVKDAIAKAEIDVRLWEVVEKNINSWPTVTKVKDAKGAERTEQTWNWQVKLKLRRKAPKLVQEGIKELLNDLPKMDHKSVNRSSIKDPHMLELSVMDHHFGKLSWKEDIEESWDLKIAKQVFLNAVDDLLERSKGFNFNKIIIPLGNDFFQANNWMGTTAKGTVVESVDDRMPKIFRLGCEVMTQVIYKCRRLADVECIWVPGNHDPETSWYLMEWLDAWFKGDKYVKINNDLQYRKYISYGVSLIGYTHGNEEKHNSLPLIMATEVPDLWAKSKYREIHLGHYHRAKSLDFLSLDEFNGVRVRVLPSLSGTDNWHYKKGYVKNVRAAEAYIWSKSNGYVGHFSASIRE